GVAAAAELAVFAVSFAAGSTSFGAAGSGGPMIDLAAPSAAAGAVDACGIAPSGTAGLLEGICGSKAVEAAAGSGLTASARGFSGAGAAAAAVVTGVAWLCTGPGCGGGSEAADGAIMVAGGGATLGGS